jgi:hypothetical protein
MPVTQTDNGSGYISREFKVVLTQKGVGHHRIKPHCPEENGIVERAHRTIKDTINEYELTGFAQAQTVIDMIIWHYNDERLHSAINYLRPSDYYRGNPEQLQKERAFKLYKAKLNRREQNINNKQKTLPLSEPDTIIINNYFQRTLCLTST